MHSHDEQNVGCGEWLWRRHLEEEENMLGSIQEATNAIPRSLPGSADCGPSSHTGSPIASPCLSLQLQLSTFWEMETSHMLPHPNPSFFI